MRAVFTTLLILVLHTTHCILDSRTDKDNLKVCTLSSVTNGSVPNVKDKYLPGEIVLYSCEAKYISITGLQWGASQCKSGEWHPVPQCTKKTCEQPSISDGWIKNTKHAYDIGTTLEYECYRDLVPAQEKSVCTIDGWSSQPLCQVKPKVCILPDITHAYLFNKKKEYNPEEILTFTCETGYKSNTRSWWGGAQCKAGEWQPTPECIDERTVCPEPPFVKYAVIAELAKVFVNQDSVEYICIHTNEKHRITCENGKWTKVPSCLQMCLVPEMSNGFSKNQSKIYEYGEKLEYECHEDYTHSEEASICTKAGWHPMPQCKILTCEVPNIDKGYVPNAARVKKEHKINDTLQYNCNGKWKRSSIDPVCTAKGWNPEPKCGDGRCLMPPKIENGDIDGEVESWYEDGDRVTYKCKLDHVAEGDKTVKCLTGVWSKPPQCMKPCFWQINGKNYKTQHQKIIKMYCPSYTEVTCKNGELLNACPGMIQ